MAKIHSNKTSNKTEHLKAPTPWPGANARLLGLGLGLPVAPLDRLANFSADDFERFTLEWATDYLAVKVPGIIEVQQRGGAGDKGRDIIAWLDPNTVLNRRWSLYQCKHYSSALGSGIAAAEIGKVLFYSHRGDYSFPQEYHFVTHKGVTSPFQDLLDQPEKLRKYVIDNWNKYIRTRREWFQQEAKKPEADVVMINGRTVDFTNLELKSGDETVNLTLMEAKLLKYLIENKGLAVSRKTILEHVWGLHEDTDTRAIDNFIVRLRKYLEDEPEKPLVLQTVRGIGYRFTPMDS